MDKELVKRLKRIFENFHINPPIEIKEDLKKEEIFFLIEFLCRARNKNVILFEIEKKEDLDFLEMYLV